MGLSFFYEFTAPASTGASDLEAFLHDVQREAKALGLDPTIVINVPFDTPERREFANRLGGNFTLQDERLKGGAILAANRLGGNFTLQDERLKGGAILADTGLEGRWWFRDFGDSPEPRYRAIVERFKERGFVRSVKDEFASPEWGRKEEPARDAWVSSLAATDQTMLNRDEDQFCCMAREGIPPLPK